MVPKFPSDGNGIRGVALLPFTSMAGLRCLGGVFKVREILPLIVIMWTSLSLFLVHVAGSIRIHLLECETNKQGLAHLLFPIRHVLQ